MRIIIVGAGRIGTNLSQSLAKEGHEIYLIEKAEEIALKANEKLDVKVVIGNGADPDILTKVQANLADLVLAVTTSDETNLVVCSLAAHLGAKRRIARVRNTSLSTTLAEYGYKQFSIDEIINPELVAAQAIVKTVESPGAIEVADFARGKLFLRSFDITKTSFLCGTKIGDLRDEDFPWPFLIIAIIRKNTVIIPKGETTIEEEDHIYVLLPSQSLGEFLSFVDPEIKMPKKIVIYGATITGKHVALALVNKIPNILLVEEDAAKAKEIAGELEEVTIINGSASEADILVECGIEATDAFIATSEDDQSNLISSVLAKKMGAKTTIITTQQSDYLSIIDVLEIDAIINPHFLVVEQILKWVRGGGISSVTKLVDCDAEAIEFIPGEGSPVTKDVIKNIKFPKNSIVGAVHSEEKVALVNGDTQIQAGQKVIVFCQESAIKKLQELFT